MNKKFWLLALSEMPRQKRVVVKILSSEYVPAVGEKLQILKISGKKTLLIQIRKDWGDTRLKCRWGLAGFIDLNNAVGT